MISREEFISHMEFVYNNIYSSKLTIKDINKIKECLIKGLTYKDIEEVDKLNFLYHLGRIDDIKINTEDRLNCAILRNKAEIIVLQERIKEFEKMLEE